MKKLEELKARGGVLLTPILVPELDALIDCGLIRRVKCRNLWRYAPTRAAYA